MAKIVLILLVLLTGCTAKTTKEIAQTISPGTAQEDFSIDEEFSFYEPLIIEEDYLTGTFTEDIENYPTIFVFHKDHTFDASINMCHGMVNASGLYSKNESLVTIVFEGEVGYSPVDLHMPFELNLEDNQLIYDKEEVLSCAFRNIYLPKEEFE